MVSCLRADETHSDNGLKRPVQFVYVGQGMLKVLVLRSA